jgi:hypothetical protein
MPFASYYSKMKKVAILQSNYIPWKGYFDLIAAVDEFIIYDDMQYTRRDWRNRNQIKTPQGLQWLTVPVKTKGKYVQTILETEIDGSGWASLHWKSLEQNYRKAPYFEEISSLLKPIYTESPYLYLSDLNRKLIGIICTYLGIKTKISCSTDYHLIDGKTERLADLCRQAGGTAYISGPAAKSYIVDSVFEARSIALRWFSYDSYPEYQQLWGEFTHFVSVVDLLFNCGRNSVMFMKNVSP